VVNSPPDSDDGDSRTFTNVPLSCEFRDKLRVAKAREGLSYDEFLRRRLDVDEGDSCDS
jgi:hypothetical protein